jgi:hypothetical protein
MERKFLVLLRRFSLRKEHFYILTLLVALFYVLAARRGASSPRLVVTLNFMPPTEFNDNSLNGLC